MNLLRRAVLLSVMVFGMSAQSNGDTVAQELTVFKCQAFPGGSRTFAARPLSTPEVATAFDGIVGAIHAFEDLHGITHCDAFLTIAPDGKGVAVARDIQLSDKSGVRIWPNWRTPNEVIDFPEAAHVEWIAAHTVRLTSRRLKIDQVVDLRFPTHAIELRELGLDLGRLHASDGGWLAAPTKDGAVWMTLVSAPGALTQTRRVQLDAPVYTVGFLSDGMLACGISVEGRAKVAVLRPSDGVELSRFDFAIWSGPGLPFIKVGARHMLGTRGQTHLILEVLETGAPNESTVRVLPKARGVQQVAPSAQAWLAYTAESIHPQLKLLQVPGASAPPPECPNARHCLGWLVYE